MKFSKFFPVVFMLALAASGAARAELVRNGSFEENAISGSFLQTATVNGWSSSASGAGAFEIQRGALQGGAGGFNPYAYAGGQYLELNVASFTSISQAINTTSNGLYTLSFAYSGRPDTAGGVASLMNVYWGDTKLNASPLAGQTNGSWSTFTIKDLVATNASTLLRFESIGPSSAPTYGSYLDAVSVNANVPEPGSVALLMLGMAGLVLVRRKKTV